MTNSVRTMGASEGFDDLDSGGELQLIRARGNNNVEDPAHPAGQLRGNRCRRLVPEAAPTARRRRWRRWQGRGARVSSGILGNGAVFSMFTDEALKYFHHQGYHGPPEQLDPAERIFYGARVRAAKYVTNKIDQLFLMDPAC